MLIRIPPEEDGSNGAGRAIVASVNEGYLQVVDVDLKSYFDSIDHELLMGLVERRVGDMQILRLIRAWLKAGVMEEGKVTHPDRGSPGGVEFIPIPASGLQGDVGEWSGFGPSESVLALTTTPRS